MGRTRLAVALAVVAAGCGADPSNVTSVSDGPVVAACDAATTTGTVVLDDFTITVDGLTAGAAVDVVNEGRNAHELKVVPLPDGDLGETAPEEWMAVVAAMVPEARCAATLQLPPGRYGLFCDLPLHFRSGMHTVVTI